MCIQLAAGRAPRPVGNLPTALASWTMLSRRLRVVSDRDSRRIILCPLNLDLTAQLDDAVDGRLEDRHRRFRVAHHRCEEVFAPQRHAGAPGWHEGLPAQEVTCSHRIEIPHVFVDPRTRTSVEVVQ